LIDYQLKEPRDFMKYCLHCGSELKGAKAFCIVCGARQDKLKKEIKEVKPEKRVSTSKETESGICIRCGEETEKKCFFCDEFACRDHNTRMQANIYPNEELMGLKAQGETRKINEGWRSFIIFACPRCSSMKQTKGLTDGEADLVNVVDNCSWYKLD
jgi:hypothetical protein